MPLVRCEVRKPTFAWSFLERLLQTDVRRSMLTVECQRLPKAVGGGIVVLAAAQSATIVHLDSRLSCPGAAQFIASRFVTFHALIAVPYLRVVASVAHHGILTRSAVRTSSCTAGNQRAQDDLSDHFGKVVHKKILLVPSEAAWSDCQVALQTDSCRLG